MQTEYSLPIATVNNEEYRLEMVFKILDPHDKLSFDEETDGATDRDRYASLQNKQNTYLMTGRLVKFRHTKSRKALLEETFNQLNLFGLNLNLREVSTEEVCTDQITSKLVRTKRSGEFTKGAFKPPSTFELITDLERVLAKDHIQKVIDSMREEAVNMLPQGATLQSTNKILESVPFFSN